MSKNQLEEMFDAYRTKQTLKHVCDTCKVCYPTASKYRISEKWDERLNKIVQAVAIRVDKKVEDHKVRHAKIARLMQKRGVDVLSSAGAAIDPRLAKDLIKDGVTIEREALGDHAPNLVIKLELPEGLVI